MGISRHCVASHFACSQRCWLRRKDDCGSSSGAVVRHSRLSTNLDTKWSSSSSASSTVRGLCKPSGILERCSMLVSSITVATLGQHHVRLLQSRCQVRHVALVESTFATPGLFRSSGCHAEPCVLGPACSVAWVRRARLADKADKQRMDECSLVAAVAANVRMSRNVGCD